LRVSRPALRTWLAALALALPAAGARAELRLEASTPAEALVVGEAVPVTVVIRNSGGRIELPSPLEFTAYGANPVRVRRPDGSSLVVMQAQLVTEQVPYETPEQWGLVLGPGESERVEFVMSYDWDHQTPIFDTPGGYEIRFVYEGGGEQVESDPLRVDFEAPAGADAEAWQQVQQMQHRPALYEPDLIGPGDESEAVRELESLLDGSGQSVFGDYARLSLGEHEIARARATFDREEKAEALGRAKRYLDGISAGFTLARELRSARKRLAAAAGAPLPPQPSSRAPQSSLTEKDRLKIAEARRVAEERSSRAPAPATAPQVAAVQQEEPPAPAGVETASPADEPSASRTPWLGLLLAAGGVGAAVVFLLRRRS
jgi:hypothetical protein